MLRFTAIGLVLSLLCLGCGRNDSAPFTPPDSGLTDGRVADSAGGDSAMPVDAPADVPVAPDAVVDAGPPPTRGHLSYVPLALRPADAVRVILMGDSISAGTGASTAALKVGNLLVANDDTTWPAEMGNDLTTFLGAGAPSVVDVAQGGATTRTLTRAQLTRLDGMLATPVLGHSVVVVTIGGNDLQGAILGGDPAGAPLTDAIANLRSLMNFFNDPVRFPDGVSVYIAAVYDPSDGEGTVPGCFFGLDLSAFIPAIDQWRVQYKALGMELGFAVIDALGHFHGHAHHFDNMANPYYDAADPTGWFSDCIHPNDRGHSELRRLFYETMNPAYVVP